MSTKTVFTEFDLTLEQLQAPLDKTIFILKGSEGFDKQSTWVKYRIVWVDKSFYNVERLTNIGCLGGLPEFLGGNGFYNSKFFWKEGVSPFDSEGKKYKTKEEAKEVVDGCVKWLSDLEERIASERETDYTKRKVISIHP